MKRKAAFVEEEDPNTGEGVTGTEQSASFSLSPERGRERRKNWRRSASDFTGDSESVSLGSVLDLIRQAKEDEAILTLVAGEHDDNAEVWKECENYGTKFRLFPLKDTVINGEDNTYVEREILLSKEAGDLDRENPDLIVAQRTCAANGRYFLQAHRLRFRGRLDVDRPYIFSKLGDEIPGVGCPDLHCTFRGIRDWETVVKGAKFASCDRNVSIAITADDVDSRKQILYDIERAEVVGSEEKPTIGVLISCADFKPVYGAFRAALEDSRENSQEGHSKPALGEGMMYDTVSNAKETSAIIGLKLVGMGPEVERGGLRADLNINLSLKY